MLVPALNSALATAVLGLAGTLLLGCGPGARAATRTPQDAECELGMNVIYQSYWSTQHAFVDLFKSSGEWLPQEVEGYTWDTGKTLDLDSQGWVRSLEPGQAAGTLMARDINGRYPGGVYDLLYEGTGRIEIKNDGKIISDRPGHHKVEVAPSDAGIHLKIVETDPSDPVRAIRFVMPGFLDTFEEQPFHPDFLEFMRPFSTLRMMDWGRTNNSTVQTWAQRIGTGHQTQASDFGVALEYQIALCNELERDAWFCIPHLADDEYAHRLAEMVERDLKPGLVAWFEYSNEVWNNKFSQNRWAEEQGMLLELSSNPFQACLRFYARRADELLNIVEQHFEGDARARMRRVLASQCANTWVCDQILDYKDVAKRADALAIAPYVGVSLGSPERLRDVIEFDHEQLFAALHKDLKKVLANISAHVKVARKHELELVAYEAGQHLAGFGGIENNEPIANLFRGANRRPEMSAIYDELLNGWNEAGGGLICAWTSIERYTKWGSWGAVEYMGQPRSEAPKLDALLRFAESLRAED